jgi:hypothetical protein
LYWQGSGAPGEPGGKEADTLTKSIVVVGRDEPPLLLAPLVLIWSKQEKKEEEK